MNRIARWLWLAFVSIAAGAVSLSALAADDFLDPDQAFRFDARQLDARTVEVEFHIADGYYMYREQFRFEASAPATLGAARLPAGHVKFDQTFAKNVETYRGDLKIAVPVQSAKGPFRLTVVGQGCADKGLCYPPAPHVAEVSLKALGADADFVKVSTAGGSLTASTASSTQRDSTSQGPTSQGPTPQASTAPRGSQSLASAVAAAIAAAPATTSATSSATSPATSPPTSAASAASADQSTDAAAATDASGAAIDLSSGDEGRLASTLQRGNLLVVVAAFFAAGLLLSLTPCVLPMVPILSSIIVGQKQPVTRAHGFALALSYSLGMAVVYTALGVAAGLAGEGLAPWLQTPGVLAAFAAALLALSLSMFGFYELQVPERLRDLLGRQGADTGGRSFGVFMMGGVSALVVSPCVAAPLAGALLYISRSRDVILGGAALFTLAMGMSVPLLLVGLSAGHVLPRAGRWMEHVKHFFGAVLVAAALWIVQPVLPAWLAMLLWGAMLIIGAVYLRVFEPLNPGPHIGWARFVKGIGVVMVMLGSIQLLGVASGGRDPLQPLSHLGVGRSPVSLASDALAATPGAADATSRATATATRAAGTGSANTPTAQPAGSEGVSFARVKTVAELEQRVRSAGRPVMLDFYADWCVSCKEMEKLTFTDLRVRDRLSRVLLLQADVTANDDDDRALLRRFRLFGPPGIVFFDASGSEIPAVRVVGYQDADRFLQSLGSAGI